MKAMTVPICVCVLTLFGCGSDLTVHVVDPVSTPAECYVCPAQYKGAPLGPAVDLPWLCQYPDLDLVMRCEPVACDDYGELVCEPVPVESQGLER